MVQRGSRRGRLLLRLFLVFLLLIAVLIAAALAYLPRVMSARAEQAIREQLGDDIQLESVRVGLTGRSIRLNGFSMPAPEGSSDPVLVSFQSLQIGLGGLQQLLEGNVAIDSLVLEQPRLAVETEPGINLNLADVLPYPGEFDEFPIVVDSARAENATVIWTDLRTVPPVRFELTNASLTITGLNSSMEPSVLGTTANLTGQLFGESPLDLKLTGNFLNMAQGLNFDASGQVAGLDLMRLRPYLRPETYLTQGRADAALEGTCRSGQMNATITLTFREMQAQAPSVGVQSANPPREMYLTSHAGEPLACPLQANLTDPRFDIIAALQESIGTAIDQQIKATR